MQRKFKQARLTLQVYCDGSLTQPGFLCISQQAPQMQIMSIVDSGYQLPLLVGLSASGSVYTHIERGISRIIWLFFCKYNDAYECFLLQSEKLSDGDDKMV